MNGYVNDYLNAPTNPNPNLTDHPPVDNDKGSKMDNVKWCPPRENIIKFNSDTQFDLSTGRGVMGIVCRDKEGKLLARASSQIFTASPLVAEALALREAVSLAVNLNFKQILFESDCLELVEACRGNAIRKAIEHVVNDIQSMKKDFTFMGLLWTNRCGNEVADLVAKLAASLSLPQNWLNSPPMALAIAVKLDRPTC